MRLESLERRLGVRPALSRDDPVQRPTASASGGGSRPHYPFIVYSDTEGSEFNIGLVAWDPVDPTRVHSAASECPPCLLQSACSMCPDVFDSNDGLMNAVAMAEALALLIFPDMLRVCRILTYQDKSTVSIMQPPTLQRVAVRDVGALKLHRAAAALDTGL